MVVLYILQLASVVVIFLYGRSTYGDIGVGLFAVATAIQVVLSMNRKG